MAHNTLAVLLRTAIIDESNKDLGSKLSIGFYKIPKTTEYLSTLFLHLNGNQILASRSFNSNGGLIELCEEITLTYGGEIKEEVKFKMGVKPALKYQEVVIPDSIEERVLDGYFPS